VEAFKKSHIISREFANYQESHAMKKKSGRRLLPDPKVCNRYGIHYSTLRNWDLDPKMEFPKPIRINKRKYRDEEELDQFDRDRAAERDSNAA
jgi:hypothetical protein